MLSNEPIRIPLADKDVLEELGKNELGRFRKALGAASDALFEEKSKGLEPKDVRKTLDRITRATQIISFLAADALETSLAVLKDKEHERATWEDRFTGIRSVSRVSPRGFMLNTVARMLKVEETAGRVSSLIQRGNEGLSDVHRVLAEAKKFVSYYEFAKKHAEKYGNESEELPVKYAVLKTWKKEKDFENFSSVAETAASGAIEVFIEGPFKLYLMISPEQFMIVLRAMTMMTSFEFENSGSEGLKESLNNLLLSQELLKRSSLYETGRELLSKTLPQYHKLWKEECDEIRREFLDDVRAERFVERFENGSLFVK